MKKGRKIVTLSVPPETAEEYEKMAADKEMSKSRLFREMFAEYKTADLKGRFLGLQRYGAIRARETRAFTEEDVERIVFQGR